MQRRRKIRSTMEDKIFEIVLTVILIGVLFATVYPFYYILVLSLNDGHDTTLGGIYWFPRVFTFDNYKTLLADTNWLGAITVSVSRTVVGTVFGVFVTSIVGYALSFTDTLGRNLYFKLFIFTMYFSGGIIPFYIIMKSVNLLNTFWIYVLPGMLNVYYLLIMVRFYSDIPKSLYESAWLDGAGSFRVYISIALPLSKASLATIGLFFAVAQWNSWMDAAYYVTDKTLRPLAYFMMELINRFAMQATKTDAISAGYAASAMTTTTMSLQMAAIIISVLPILGIYPFLQKYFVKGVMIGSVKE